MTTEALLALCVGKERFTSAHLAHKAAKRRPGRCKYLCNKCGGWHVGHIEAKAWRKARTKRELRGEG